MTGPDPFPGCGGFSYRPALPYEAGVSRRDPSPVVRAGGRYHAWYSRSTIPWPCLLRFDTDLRAPSDV